MKKISSGSVYFYKRIFPLIWFGGLTAFAVMGVTEGQFEQDQWPFLLIPCLMMVVGFVVLKKVVWDLADEVEDCGDSLRVRKGGEEERIPLSNIMNVNSSMNMNPPRVTLRLVRAGRFGNEVSFSPQRPISFSLAAKNPMIEDLIVRVDRARRGSGG